MARGDQLRVYDKQEEDGTSPYLSTSVPIYLLENRTKGQFAFVVPVTVVQLLDQCSEYTLRELGRAAFYAATAAAAIPFDDSGPRADTRVQTGDVHRVACGFLALHWASSLRPGDSHK